MPFGRLGSIGRESLRGGGQAAPIAPPALPLATGAKVLGFGHSMISRAHSTQGGGANPITLIRATKRGVLNWCKWLDQRFNIDVWGDQNAPSWATPVNVNMYNGANQGFNGDALQYQSSTTPGTLARTPYSLARKPDIIYLDIGQNDIFYLNLDASTLQGLYDLQLRQLNRAGVWVLASTVYPSLTYGPGTAQDNVRLAFNSWLKAQPALRTGLHVVDADTVLGTSVNLSYQDTASGGHLTDLGGYTVAANLVLPALQAMVTSGNHYDTNPADNNIFPSATAGMLGTSGSKGSGVTGNVATGWSAFRNAGTSTIVASKEVISGALEKQVFTITPVSDATPTHIGTLRLTTSPTMTSLGLNVGDWIQFLWFIELSAWNYWLGHDVFLGADASGTAKMQSWANAVGTLPEPANALSFWSVGEPMQIPSGANNVSFGTQSMLNYQWSSAGTGTGIIKVSQPILRKITDPRTAWHLP